MIGSDIYVNQENYIDGSNKPSGAFVGQQLLATNGNAWEWSGTGWYQIKISGSAVSNAGFGDITTDAWGTGKVSVPISLFHGMFTFDVPPSMWLVHENNIEILNSSSTVVTSVDGALNITTTNLITQSDVRSRRHPRYQPNRGHLFSTAVILPNKTNNGERNFGLMEDANGVFFRLKSDGLLYGVIRTGGAETEHLLDTTVLPDFDAEKGNVYDIQFQWRGVGNYKFFINLRHVKTVENLGTLTVLSLENPSMAIGFESIRTTEDVLIVAGCADVTSEGGGVNREQFGEGEASVTAINAGDGILALRNPLLAPNGEVNTRDIRLARITIGADKKSTFKVYQTRDSSAVVGGAWAAAKTGSFVEINSTMTSVDTAKMESFSTFQIIAGLQVERENPSRETIDFFGIHGDYIVIVCDVGVVLAVTATIEFGEEI